MFRAVFPKTKPNSHCDNFLKKLLCYFGGQVNITGRQVCPSSYYTFLFLSQKSIIAHGFSGIPGSNGIPGMPGIPGAPGPQGQQGKDGGKGEPGVKGPRGMTGTRGQKGNPGSLGKNGAPGMMGIKGDKGDEGSRGSSGPPGIKGVKGEQGSKGEKGEIVNSAVSQTNWKQCVWKNDDDRDSGKIKVQKYLENAMKMELSIRANLSWPSLKETLRNAAKLKISINNSVHSCRQEKYRVIIKFFPLPLL